MVMNRNTILVLFILSSFIIMMTNIQCSHKVTGIKESEEPSSDKLLHEGKKIFRYETFGDEAFWTDKLHLEKAINGSKHGGVGDGLSPKAALDLGLKVDLSVLPGPLKKKIAEGKFLDDVDVTLALIKLDAVLGVVGKFDGDGNLKSVGLTCASCHSTVKSETGIGARQDGWPNRDLNVGAIISLAPDLSALTKLLDVDEATVRKVLASWGPGKFDALLNLDGKAFRPDGKSAATLIPEAFGHAGHNLHTWTGGWGNVTYWNAYVANLELVGQGNFYDERLNDPVKYPVAARAGFGNKRSNPDMVSDKLAALQVYQLSLAAPKPPADSFDKDAAARGKELFSGKAKCATCHVPPLFSEPGWNTHKAEDIGIDDFQANRSPDSSYVTQGLAGLWTHMKGGFYHDGRFATLMDVVNHYNGFKNLNLSEPEKKDLVEYLKSL
jgi:hypothetical protein